MNAKYDKDSDLYHVYYNLCRRKDVKVCKAWCSNPPVFSKWVAFADWAYANGYKENSGCRIQRINKSNPLFSPSNTEIVSPSYAKNFKRLISLSEQNKGKIKIKMRKN